MLIHTSGYEENNLYPYAQTNYPDQPKSFSTKIHVADSTIIKQLQIKLNMHNTIKYTQMNSKVLLK